MAVYSIHVGVTHPAALTVHELMTAHRFPPPLPPLVLKPPHVLTPALTYWRLFAGAHPPVPFASFASYAASAAGGGGVRPPPAGPSGPSGAFDPGGPRPPAPPQPNVFFFT